MHALYVFEQNTLHMQTDSHTHFVFFAGPFCLARNQFPPHYADNITEQNLPAGT